MRQIALIALVTAVPALAQVAINDFPSREFGQTTLVNPQPTSAAPNLIEGREFSGPSGIAFDFSTAPPIVYVADTGNNRILAWKNTAGLANGAQADLQIGQRDFVSNLIGGPGTVLTTGLNQPTGLAVDQHGNLYVADTGNNRILRFPAPFQQSNSPVLPDLVIGQLSYNSGNFINEGQSAPTAKGLALAVQGPTGLLLPVGLAVDSGGNLWATDDGNYRVLRFPAANLTANTQEPEADLVLGQTDFVSNTRPGSSPNPQLNKLSLVQPTGLAFDSVGNLFVVDRYARVLQFGPNLFTGASAVRVLGIQPPPAQGQPAPAYPTQYSLGAIAGNSIQAAPEGVFTSGNYVFVCDTPENRVVRYEPASNWLPETADTPSPSQADVTGQADFVSGKVNHGAIRPDSMSLALPIAGAVDTTTNNLWIVDTGNNRVLVFSQQPSGGPGGFSYTAANQVLGQIDFPYNSPNLIEGREVWFSGGSSGSAGGIVVDTNSNPPHLYIADTFNNRVLGFVDARKVGTDARSLLTQKADLVIGQPDLNTALPNYSPSNQNPTEEQQPNSTGFIHPIGLLVDAAGNLYVADSGNGRVLRFPAPFSQPAGQLPQANLVLGQSTFTQTITDPSRATMRSPFGLAQFSDGSIAVSDSVHNRILVFQKPAGGDFTMGQQALVVVGQQDFLSTQAGSGLNQLNSPRHIATDTSDRLYVADSNNGRMIVFSRPIGNGQSATTQVTGLNQPQGVIVSPITGESWVTDTNDGRILRYPEFETLSLNPAPTETLVNRDGPLAIALDQFDDLIVAEGANRVAFYFPKMFYRHAATYSATIPLTPGMLAILGRLGKDFDFPQPLPQGNQPLPWPTVLDDVQVTVNGVAAPIFALIPGAIYFQVPMSTPDSGTADYVVSRPSTGQILAAGTFTMQQASPGIFTQNQIGTLAAAASNEDGSPNTPSNRVAAGGVITLWLTGAGKIAGVPPDGTAPGGAFTTPVNPLVFINSVTPATVLYSGTSPQYPGLWQLNVQVPETTPPGTNIWVLVKMYDYPSNVGGTPSPTTDQLLQVGNGLITTISVK
ncbi:MAG TPA: hypothetical protein VFW83_02420 [Bryobacteraceae bacterium]|nr:hypothetical protein [Bryobacteraceae bacterium]